MASVLSRIKSEKQLSLRHWRYRLLHWFFGCKPESVKESPLPEFLYSHYCPLFHLTNIIAMFFPIILLVKIVIILVLSLIEIGKFFWYWGSLGFGRVKLFLEKHWPEMKKPEKVKEEEPERDEAYWIALAAKAMPRYLVKMDPANLRDFDLFWILKGDEMQVSKEKLEPIWQKYVDLILEARKIADEKRKRRQERIIFWANFSSIFVKWTLNIIYGGATLALLYAAVVYGVPSIIWIVSGLSEAVAWLLTIEFIPVLLTILNVAVRVIGVLVIAALVFFLMKQRPVADAGVRFIGGFAPIGKAAGAFWMFFENGIKGFFEFCSMFYAENCPPIKIVAEEEEDIASIIEEVS